jgi:hypothetical protein
MLLDPTTTKIYAMIYSQMNASFPPDNAIRIAFTKAYRIIVKIGVAWSTIRRTPEEEMTGEEFKLFPDANETWKAFVTFLPFLNSHELLDRFEYFHERYDFINENDYLQFANLLKNMTRSVKSWNIIISTTGVGDDGREVSTFNTEKLAMYVAYQDAYSASTRRCSHPTRS